MRLFEKIVNTLLFIAVIGYAGYGLYKQWWWESHSTVTFYSGGLWRKEETSSISLELISIQDIYHKHETWFSRIYWNKKADTDVNELFYEKRLPLKDECLGWKVIQREDREIRMRLAPVLCNYTGIIVPTLTKAPSAQ